MNSAHHKTAVVLALAILLQGCESVRVTETMDRVDRTATEASALADGLRNGKQSPAGSGRFTNKPWVDTTPLSITNRIPAGNDCTIVFNQSMDIYDFAQVVSDECKLAVRVTPDVFDGGASNSNNSTTGASAATPAVSSAPEPSLADFFPSSQGQSTNNRSSNGSRRTYVRGIEYAGKLSGLLDQVTTQLGVSWRFNKADRSITIFYLDTKTFNFYAFASKTDMQSVVQSGTTSSAGAGGGESSGGTSTGISGYSGSSQATSVSLQTSLVDDIENNVKAMLSNVGRMSMSKSTGMITVTDRPDVVERVGTYLDAENKNVTKQVLLNVQVYSVTLSDKDAVGIDWNLVYKAANGNFGFDLTNTFQNAPTGAVSGNVGILDGDFAGSTAIVQALSQQGRVSVVTSPSVTTLNLQPVPVQVARQTGYLAAVQTTNTPDVGSTTSLTPGTVTSGFNMDLLPFVMSDDELLLQYSINISSLVNIRSASSGDNRIEIPEIDNRIFSQKVRLKSGETLVLSGFDQTSEKGNQAGTGASWNWFLGGGADRDTTRDVIVVMITPIVKA